jgi:hypothetical protein
MANNVTLGNGNTVRLLVPKEDRNLSTILPGGKYGPNFSNPILTKSGPNLNIARSGTNGLTTSSYTSGSVWEAPGWTAESAFDGHTYLNGQLYVGAGSQIGQRAYESASGSFPSSGPNYLALGDQYIKIDFGQQIMFSGFRLIHGVGYAHRCVKDLEVYGSDDNVTFTLIQAYTAAQNSTVTGEVFSLATLPAVQTVPYRYLKFKLLSLYGSTFTHIDEIEVYVL